MRLKLDHECVSIPADGFSLILTILVKLDPPLASFDKSHTNPLRYHKAHTFQEQASIKHPPYSGPMLFEIPQFLYRELDGDFWRASLR